MVVDEARVRLCWRAAKYRADVTWGVGIGSVRVRALVERTGRRRQGASDSEFAAAFGGGSHSCGKGAAKVPLVENRQSCRRGAVW